MFPVFWDKRRRLFTITNGGYYMKKFANMLLILLSVAAWAPTAFAFQNEYSEWDRWNNHDRRYRSEREQERRPDYGNRAGYQYGGQEKHWYGDQQVSNMRVFYTDRNERRVFRISFETNNGREYWGHLRREHGMYTYKKYTQEGLAYYWIGRETIIRLTIRNDGRAFTSIWHRDDAERFAEEQGYVDSSAIAEYGQYYDDMPSEVSEKYILSLHLHE
jgi:hypothetical protein